MEKVLQKNPKITKVEILANLKRIFGFNSFKGKQLEVIQNLLSNKDTFVIMPTGGGKSMCYQLPSLMLHGTSIVISPLIALMKNQVDLIRSYGKDDAIAHFLNSSLNKEQENQVKEDLRQGKCKLLYVAPETLKKEENIQLFKKLPISFFAIDEAHCISEWGHDFRPEYRKIQNAIQLINPSLPKIALTATATPKVRSDIIKNLGLKDHKLFLESFNRPNLFYQIIPKKNKDQGFKTLITFILNQNNSSGIIYTTSRKTTEEIAEVLCANEISATAYHAGLDSKTRTQRQDDFLNEKNQIIVATIAFGMGIDKPDIRFVIHYNLPKSIENYYQETGRAGRDGLASNCLLLFSQRDISKLEILIKDKPLSEREISHQLIYEMVAYAETGMCKRKFLLHYFGENYTEENCKNCDNCKNPKEVLDVTKEVLILIKVIKTLKERFNGNYVKNILIGKENSQTKMYRHQKMDIFGIGKNKDELVWESIIRHCLFNGIISKDIEEYGLLKITPKGHKFIKKQTPIHICLNHSFDETDSKEDKEFQVKYGTTSLDEKLFKMLKSLQKEEGKKHKLPPYVIMSEVSISEMTYHYPTTLEQLGKISGIGKNKAARYGKPFVELIRNYVKENNIDVVENIAIKSVTNKNATKVAIIQNIDKKIPLETTAKNKGLSYTDLIAELDTIVNSGTKINIDYELNNQLSEIDIQEAIEYFKRSKNDDIYEALKELGEEYYTTDHIRLLRIKFISDYSN